VKLGSSDDNTIIATKMEEVEAMMDPEEKSISIYKYSNDTTINISGYGF
jgi:hypothetical protein